ncbi:hypothetical protein B0T16DRAFT_349774, partial [Cercophora newfieldiana]
MIPALALLAAAPALVMAGAATPKYLITFGDSYSQTGFNISLDKPSAANPLGNPTLPGWTASGGLNWVGFLTAHYNATPLLTYNFAYGGATTNASLVTPWRPDVLSFTDQIGLFAGSIGATPRPAYARWKGEDALVGVWMGVNDTGNAWWKGEEEYKVLVDAIMDSYFGGLEVLVTAGARNFVLLGVPPIHKTPTVLLNTVEQQETEAVSIRKYNDAIATRLEAFKAANRGVTAILVDTAAPFNEALANPTEYGAPNATCYNGDGVSCLWFNDYHPGVAINRLVAEAVATAWKG